MDEQTAALLLGICQHGAPEEINEIKLASLSGKELRIIRKVFLTLTTSAQWNVRSNVEEAVTRQLYQMERDMLLRQSDSHRRQTASRRKWKCLRRFQECLY